MIVYIGARARAGAGDSHRGGGGDFEAPRGSTYAGGWWEAGARLGAAPGHVWYESRHAGVALSEWAR